MQYTLCIEQIKMKCRKFLSAYAQLEFEDTF
jgi:hypothetical protein